MLIDNEINQFEALLNEPDPRPIHYLFQHRALPKALFENHPELMAELLDGKNQLLPLLHFWSRAEFYYLNQTSEITDELEDYPDGIKATPYNLGNKLLIIYSMPAPVASPECFFVGMLIDTNEQHSHSAESSNSRYFTFEKQMGDRKGAIFGEWTSDQTHLVYGEFDENLSTFLSAITRII